uniref:Uncharacterized protein n=1 Tax=Alexandrium monilatum TaxID=311494 RepID=A0A7S4W0S2_9DINO
MISQFGPQELTKTSWAVATLVCQHVDPLLYAISVEAIRSIQLFVPRDLAGAAQAPFTLGVVAVIVTHAVCCSKAFATTRSNSQDIANATRLTATASAHGPPSSGTASRIAVVRASRRFPRHTASTAWSLGTTGHCGQHFMGTIDPVVVSAAGAHNTQSPANLPRRLAKVSPCRHSTVFITSTWARASSSSPKPQGAANLGWMSARLDIPRVFVAVDTTLASLVSAERSGVQEAAGTSRGPVQVLFYRGFAAIAMLPWALQ